MEGMDTRSATTKPDTGGVDVVAELRRLSGKIDAFAERVSERQADYIGDQLHGNILKQEIAARLDRIERHLGIGGRAD